MASRRDVLVARTLSRVRENTKITHVPGKGGVQDITRAREVTDEIATAGWRAPARTGVAQADAVTYDQAGGDIRAGNRTKGRV